ncbi:Kef-type potassium/proton antiporter, CPA2 family [Devosia lucknowensis]|uniref:Kef-type potassium/proton antiporter, CPA2 family n=1 Tax=Devosia lucknowensis TaxID=1096929 RepID=A0A1Y6G7P7_9HYPH|nr:Kef-type potassium/proton antiporter, CPA2 family [Devosia lucknowensis]
MHHDTPLISTIVAGLVLAYIFGMIANRFKMPPLVGYLFAGILVGPYTPGFVADQQLGAELAELGVILLMFGVGLHFSLKDLMSVRALAIPGAVVQMGFATLLGAALGLLLGWDLFGSILFGLALSVASTVVLLKALQDRRLIESERGRIAVGWLIVEDLAMVLALVLVPAIASLNGADAGVHDPFVSFVEQATGAHLNIWGILGLTVVKVAAFVGFMLVVGRRIIPWALHGTAHTGSRELFRLAVLAIALGVALGSAVLFGVSLALGAFFAGMILSESELSHRAANETLPLRDAFAVLFFVSVGMLFDPSILVTSPLLVLATVFIIVIGKSLAAFAIVVMFKRPVSTALTISASLAQIGEFSFILASMGVALAVLPPEGQDLILAGALISIVLNPVVFWVLDLLKPRIEARVARRKEEPLLSPEERLEPLEAAKGPATTDAPTQPAVDRGAPGADDDTGEPSHQAGHTVLVGYGQVGRIVGAGIKADGGGLVVIEDSDHDVAAARAEGLEVVFGNAASEEVLKLANLPAAQSLLVAISNGFEAGSVCESGRKLNPDISIIARAYSEEEETFLRSCGATTVIRGEREIGKGILAYLRSDEGRAAIKPAEPRLPLAENILSKAAVAAIVTEVVAPVPAEAEPAEPAATEPDVAEEVAAQLIVPAADTVPLGDDAEDAAPKSQDAVKDEAASVPEVIVLGPPVEPEPEPAAEAEVPATVADETSLLAEAAPAGAEPDPVLPVVDAVETVPVADPEEPSDAAETEAEVVPPASVETVQPTPSIGEAPPAIDEIVNVPSDNEAEPEKTEDKPGEVPPVVPEPKG